MPDAPASLMIRLLDREAEAIKTGAFDQLAAIAVEKDAVRQALSDVRPSVEEMQIIRAKANRNEALFVAAIRGVKVARARLTALAEVQNGLRVYSAEGQMKTVETADRGFERKA